MLAYRRPLDQLTPGEYAERFAHELAVSHNRPLKLAKAIAVMYAHIYRERSLEPEHAAAVWVQEFGTKTPPQPAKPQPKIKADAGMGRDNRTGALEVVDEAMRRPVKQKKRL